MFPARLKKMGRSRKDSAIRTLVAETLVLAKTHGGVEKIESELEEELRRETTGQSTSTLAKWRRKGEQALKSKYVLLTVVLFCISDCALVLGELILDLHKVKDTLETSEQVIEDFKAALHAQYPDEIPHTDMDIQDVFLKIQQARIIWHFHGDNDSRDDSTNCTRLTGHDERHGTRFHDNSARSPNASRSGPRVAVTRPAAGTYTPLPSPLNSAQRQRRSPLVSRSSWANRGSRPHRTGGRLQTQAAGGQTGQVVPSSSPHTNHRATRDTGQKVEYVIMYEDVRTPDVINHTVLVAVSNGSTIDDLGGEGQGQVYSLEQEIAYILHKISITLLAILAFETILKAFCVGPPFFKRKLETFDMFIVLVSFIVDMAFMQILPRFKIQDFVFILAFLLPWRVIRVVDSLVVAVQDHEHFRLKLMYSRKKKIQNSLRETEVKLQFFKAQCCALKRLCLNEGVDESKVEQIVEVDEYVVNRTGKSKCKVRIDNASVILLDKSDFPRLSPRPSIANLLDRRRSVAVDGSRDLRFDKLLKRNGHSPGASSQGGHDGECVANGGGLVCLERGRREGLRGRGWRRLCPNRLTAANIPEEPALPSVKVRAPSVKAKRAGSEDQLYGSFRKPQTPGDITAGHVEHDKQALSAFSEDMPVRRASSFDVICHVPAPQDDVVLPMAETPALGARSPDEESVPPVRVQPVGVQSDSVPPVSTKPVTVPPDTADSIHPGSGQSVSHQPVRAVIQTSVKEQSDSTDVLLSVSVLPDTARPGSVQSDTVQPYSFQPDSVQPANVPPNSVQPNSVQPDSVAPDSVQPNSVRPDSVQPNTVQPASVPPNSVQPNSVQPDSIQPDSVQLDSVPPNSVKPNSVQPDSVQLDSVQQDSVQPDSVQLDSVQPDSVQPDSVPPDSLRPDIVQPHSVQPDSGQPDSGQPHSVQPDSGRPDRVQPDNIKPDVSKSDVTTHLPKSADSCNVPKQP